MATVTLPCNVDFDCPPAKLCYSNVSWLSVNSSSTFQGQCLCHTWYGWSGPDCENLWNGTTAFWVLLLIGQMLWGSVFLVWAWYKVFVVFYEFGREIKFNAMLRTLLATALGFVFHIMWRAVMLYGTLTPQDAHVREFDTPDTNKITQADVLRGPVVWLVMVAIVVASVNVSVLWVEFGSRKGDGHVDRVTQYRRAVLAFEILFALCMGGAATVNRFDLASIIAAPFIVVLIITFMVGRRRMVRILAEAVSLAEERDGPSAPTSRFNKREKTAAQRTRRVMTVIKRCSTHVIAALLISTLGNGLYIVIAGATWKEYVQQGKWSFVLLLSDVVAIGMLYLLTVVFFYVNRSANKLLRSRGGQGSSKNSSVVDGSSIMSATEGGSTTGYSSFHQPGRSYLREVDTSDIRITHPSVVRSSAATPPIVGGFGGRALGSSSSSSAYGSSRTYGSNSSSPPAHASSRTMQVASQAGSRLSFGIRSPFLSSSRMKESLSSFGEDNSGPLAASGARSSEQPVRKPRIPSYITSKPPGL